jgi:hypothetical protein
MTRIEVSSVNSITRVIVDKRNQLITTLIKSVGKSVGYVETQSSVDSSTKEILKQSKIQFNDDSKEISGFKCKSADFELNMGGKVTLITVWYCPEFKFRSIVGLSVPGLDTLPGAPIQAITKLPQGINTVFTVNKITPDNTIDDKIFQVPKGYQILKKDEAAKSSSRRLMSIRLLSYVLSLNFSQFADEREVMLKINLLSVITFFLTSKLLNHANTH